MTTNETLNPTLTDPRPLLLRAADQITPYVAAAHAGELDRPTPCSDWTVRDLLAHLVAVERRIVHIIGGGHPFELPSQVDDVPDDAWSTAWAAGLADVGTVLAEPDVLERTVQHPAGTFPAPQALMAYVSELTAHGWDLAIALGYDVSGLDQDLAAASLGPVRRFLPAEPRASDRIPFGPVVPVADDATPYDRLLGWYGRDPGWSPS
jgi:uncharacterized protein (TIGR03086 family)